MKDLVIELGEKHRQRVPCAKAGNIRFEVVLDLSWCGYDLSAAPYSICVKDPKRNLSLYSITLYQFKTRQDAKDFCSTVIWTDAVEMFLQELTEHHYDLTKELEQKCQEFSTAFWNELTKTNLSPYQFQELMRLYAELPSYAKKFFQLTYSFIS